MNFLFRQLLIISPGHDIKRPCPWPWPLTAPWRHTGKRLFYWVLYFSSWFPRMKNWPKTGGGVAGGGGLGSKNNWGEPLVGGIKNNRGVWNMKVASHYVDTCKNAIGWFIFGSMLFISKSGGLKLKKWLILLFLGAFSNSTSFQLYRF